MQATQPISTGNPAKAALAAIALAVAVVIGLITTSFLGASVPSVGTGAGAAPAPLVLDPDARGAAGPRGSIVHIAQ